MCLSIFNRSGKIENYTSPQSMEGKRAYIRCIDKPVDFKILEWISFFPLLV